MYVYIHIPYTPSLVCSNMLGNVEGCECGPYWNLKLQFDPSCEHHHSELTKETESNESNKEDFKR